MKKFIIYYLFLVLAAASTAIRIQAQENNKETAEDIKPPEEEGWIEPGDKELYTLKLTCITPKTGITGEVFIYFGIYVKSPYELKIVDDTLLINNLPYHGPLDFRKKLYERWTTKMDTATELTDEEENFFSRLNKVNKEIKEKHDSLIVKYKDDYDRKTEEVINELNDFLKHHAEIEYYKIFPGIYVQFKLKNSPYQSLCGVELLKTLRTIRDPETDPPARESDKRYLESLLKDTFVEKYQAELNPFSSIDIYLKAAKVMQSNLSDIEKIKKLYILLNDLDKAKLVFYNFNYEEFLVDFDR